MKKIKILRVFDSKEKSQKVIAPECEIADSFFARAVGLLGRKTLTSEQALFIHPCNSIHMWGMRFPIDALFLKRNSESQWTVVKVASAVPAWKLLPVSHFGADAVLEMASGSSEKWSLTEGQVLCID